MQSNGGRLPASAMRANAINALLSGPAAGVMGAVRQAARSGFTNLITLDIGGTSTDVCVVVDGKPQLTHVVLDRWAAGSRAAPRHQHGRRRWRLDHLGRRRRDAQGRAPVGRRRSGARLLRPRRHAADAHGCARHPTDRSPGSLSRRADAARYQRRRCRPAADCRALRPDHRGRSRQRRAPRQRQHRARHPAHLDGARL